MIMKLNFEDKTFCVGKCDKLKKNIYILHGLGGKAIFVIKTWNITNGTFIYFMGKELDYFGVTKGQSMIIHVTELIFSL